MFSSELECRNCGWRTVSGRVDAIGRLKLIGMLRRDPDPADELLAVLFPEAAPRMSCPLCKEKRLVAKAAEAVTDDGDWLSAVLCEICRAPISPERVEAIPNVKRCVSCQSRSEAGATEVEPDFCPRCGALVEVRVSRGAGITRYRRFCTGDPPCRL